MAAASFTRLGIEPTSDQKAIRRAYAAALKRIDQAADPEGFAILRGAYEHARSWADIQIEEGESAACSALPLSDAPQAGPDAAPGDTPEFAPESGMEAVPRQAPPAHAQEPGPAVQAEWFPPSREELEAGIEHWTRRLMQAPDDEVAQMLASALADRRLDHLEARDALAWSLARAMRLQPDGRLALFNGARRAFDWNGLSAPFPQDQDLSDWADMLLDQMEQYSQLPPPLRVRLDAVLRLAHRWAEPNLVQAYWHGRDFAQLLSIAPHLSVLDLGWARIEAWRTASARFDRGRNALRWLAANKLKMVLAAICVMGLVLMYRDARDGTTYEKPGPTREQLANGLVTVHAQRAAPEVQPCQVRSPLSPPLGCPAAQTGQASPEPWPMAMPKALFITGAPALSYPPQAKSAGAKGTVWVRVMLDVQGKVLRSALIFPSGNSTLDQAAVVASSGVRMMPAIQDGNAVPSQAVLVFSYEIAAP